MLLRVVIAGPKALRRRDSLDIWYGERRVDPDRGAQDPAESY
jgi:hypothetical protein